MYVEEATFARHLAFFRRHFRVVSLAEFLERPSSPEPRLVITFDDGWLDNYTRAWPLLRGTGLPATVFLASGLVGSEIWLWSDRAAYLAAQSWPEVKGLWHTLLGQGQPEGASQPEFTARLIARLKALDPGRREERLEAASQELSISFPRRRLFLDWAEAAEMAGGGISFGCHSAGHTDLTRQGPEELERELGEPLQLLRDRPGFVPVLSYPYGAWSRAVAEAARRAGYAAAVSMALGLNSARTERFALRRVGLHQDVTRTNDLLAYHLLRASLAGAS